MRSQPSCTQPTQLRTAGASGGSLRPYERKIYASACHVRCTASPAAHSQRSCVQFSCEVDHGMWWSWSDVSSGIPKGQSLVWCFLLCILTLWLRLIQSDSELYLDSELYFFADDAKIYHVVNSEQDSRDLQADLYRMCEWSENSLLRFRPINVCGWELG